MVTQNFHMWSYYLQVKVDESKTTLLKKFSSKVDGFTFVHFYLKVITSDEKVVYKQEKSSLEGIIFWERLPDTETFWQISLPVNIEYLLPINSVDGLPLLS